MAYKLEMTTAEGRVKSTHAFPDSTVRSELIHRFLYDSEMVDMALQILNDHGGIFTLHIQEGERILSTANLSILGDKR